MITHAMEGSKTFNIPTFVLDENCNFIPDVLSRANAKFIKEVLIRDSYNAVCLANSFIPMATQTVEQILIIITKFKFSRSRDLLMSVFRLGVHINRFYAGKNQVKHMITMMKSLFDTEEAMRQLDRALMGLFVDARDNSYMPLIALSLHENGLPDSKFIKAVRLIQTTVNSFHNRPDADIEQYAEKLRAYNYLYKIPKYSLKEAVDIYSDNLKDLTIGVNKKPTLLFTSSDDAYLSHIYNDLLFLTSTWNMIYNCKKEIRRLNTWIKYEINSIMETAVLVGFQLPDLKETILDLAALISNMNLVSPDKELFPHYKLILAKLFEICIFATKANICILPSFIKGHLIEFEDVLKRSNDDEDLNYLLLKSRDSDDEYDEDKPPIQVDPGRVDNVLTDSDFFNVTPENAFSSIAIMPISYDKTIDVEDNEIQVLEVEMQSLSAVVYGAVASKYGLSLEQVIRKLNRNEGRTSSRASPSHSTSTVPYSPPQSDRSTPTSILRQRVPMRSNSRSSSVSFSQEDSNRSHYSDETNISDYSYPMADLELEDEEPMEDHPHSPQSTSSNNSMSRQSRALQNGQRRRAPTMVPSSQTRRQNNARPRRVARRLTEMMNDARL
ncbi:U14 [Human betaherpesvirus 6B]|uniref:Phosphoprotein 85 n=1 Tax=Human herpesvirus 6B (strain Z29) TaxID=36351 RepID=PP85_HHV6Z|nr:hypothetical protein HhV6Bgp020 [Human betaherpesvirus 6B]Q9QJ49.1 RecName: Full=Phosphoprotein 85; Short=pp85; AltName: Full=Protein U14 [Human herpesvirus 6 strain Z29]pir/T44161/ hypothetical protein U14 [imported] - human herpesvirus 6 (strain Z29) [Human betaherpesvirus 6]AAD49629.1 U14 [Human betaherpesvirus 6B]